MIEEIKTNTFFIWQNFSLCTVLPLDGLTVRCLEFRHNTHRLVLIVLLCLQQVERIITVSTKTCYDKYTKYVWVHYPFSCHSIPAILKRVYVCTTWRFPFVVVHCTQPSVMYQLCTFHYNRWKPPCSTNVNTFQHCRYAVAREWIVNANVLSVLIVWGYRRCMSVSSFKVYSAICDVSVVYNAVQKMETTM